MNKSIQYLAVAAVTTFAVGSASAYAIFSGADINNSDSIALTSTLNSSAAETLFKTGLIGISTENFENVAANLGTPLALNFGGAIGVATLSGGSGTVAQVTGGGTDGFGRYSVPGGTKYFDVAAGSFLITFAQEVQSLGFYGVDFGDLNPVISRTIMFLCDFPEVISLFDSDFVS